MPDNPLSYEEHSQLGQEMQKTRIRLLELAKVLEQVYGPSSRSAVAFQRMNEAMERVCGELANQAIADCPGRSADQLYR